MKKKLSRTQLIERLKAISQEQIPEERNMGAMCYSMMSPPEKSSRCERCGKDIIFNSWHEDEIPNIVNEMVKLGYDAKVEILCDECFEKVKNELYPGVECDALIDSEHPIFLDAFKRNFLFYFRTDHNEPYHLALANTKFNYQPVLAFLQGKSSYQGYFDEDRFLKEEIHVLEYMTGIKVDE